MSTVYAVNMSKKHDTTAAARYGDIKYLSYRYVFGDEIENEALPLHVENQTQKFAELFNPEKDYLLIIGDHLQLISFVAKLASRYNRFRVLRWDRIAAGYFPVWIEAR